MRKTSSFSLQHDDFDHKTEYDLLRHHHPQAGAIVCFTGLVRDWSSQSRNRIKNPVQSIDLSIYPGMTEKSIEQIVAQSIEQFDILALRVIHRHGQLSAGEQIVFVGVASQHREQAFMAAEMTMDYLKAAAVFWKKERYPGTPEGRWIEPTAADHAALSRWQMQREKE